ncbi:hypothetical protein HK405_012235 [Cladochytrium tenue]|nr:hypothetical protein HK405_012235 [Cladochytrium tenue]
MASLTTTAPATPMSPSYELPLPHVATPEPENTPTASPTSARTACSTPATQPPQCGTAPAVPASPSCASPQGTGDEITAKTQCRYVCVTAPVLRAFVPCGHLALCDVCADRSLAPTVSLPTTRADLLSGAEPPLRVRATPRCPVCRRVVRRRLRVFPVAACDVHPDTGSGTGGMREW